MPTNEYALAPPTLRDAQSVASTSPLALGSSLPQHQHQHQQTRPRHVADNIRMETERIRTDLNQAKELHNDDNWQKTADGIDLRLTSIEETAEALLDDFAVMVDCSDAEMLLSRWKLHNATGNVGGYREKGDEKKGLCENHFVAFALYHHFQNSNANDNNAYEDFLFQAPCIRKKRLKQILNTDDKGAQAIKLAQSKPQCNILFKVLGFHKYVESTTSKSPIMTRDDLVDRVKEYLKPDAVPPIMEWKKATILGDGKFKNPRLLYGDIVMKALDAAIKESCDYANVVDVDDLSPDAFIKLLKRLTVVWRVRSSTDCLQRQLGTAFKDDGDVEVIMRKEKKEK